MSRKRATIDPDSVTVGEFVQDVITFDVPSETTPGVKYEVTVGDGFGRCQCPAWYWNATVPMTHDEPTKANSCKHLEAAYPLWYDIVKARREEQGEAKTLVLHVPPGVTIEVA